MKTLVLASCNRGKLAEIAATCSRGSGFDLVTQGELGVADAIEETASTFVENALIKARHACARDRPAGAGRRFRPVRRCARRRARACIRRAYAGVHGDAAGNIAQAAATR